MQEIELLAPAANADIAIEAIKHGADAVYIGPPDHGARKAASNSLEDIKRIVDFAHPFGVKVYATVNTIIYDHELVSVEKLIRDLYIIGVDAIIVQDMGILRMDIPPIALHASTQCDTHTPEKARFLEEVGFSQIVLARELTLEEIRKIRAAVNVPLECFIHGALCVSYSGRCHASQATKGRSANRGDCAQICRLPYILTDSDDKVLTRNKHLLSLKDFNLSDRIEDLMFAGVSSFKIEGRLKDAEYVKNITAWYRQKIDSIISEYPEKFKRSSAGKSIISFIPNPYKSFNRGFTQYFIDQRRPKNISSILTPKSMGEPIKELSELHNGDGISFFNQKGEYMGVMVNGIKNNKIIGNKPLILPPEAEIHRTFDSQWQKALSKSTAERKLNLDVKITEKYIEAEDERGVHVIIPLNADFQQAKTPQQLRDKFDKFGNSIYKLKDFEIETEESIFIPASQLSEARRRMLEALATACRATYTYSPRRKENREINFPEKEIDYQSNVANSKAMEFYSLHGVEKIEKAIEVDKITKKYKNRSVMTTRHCILREMGKCLKENPNVCQKFKLPLSLKSGNIKFELFFDCKNCEMHVLHSKD